MKVISTENFQEKLDGQDAAATMVEVTIQPGQSGEAHRHPRPAIVYVLEGEYEHGINDQPIKMSPQFWRTLRSRRL